MKNLVNILNNATKFYDQGLPTMSDLEWDSLYFDLLQKEKELGYALPDSPTKKVVYSFVNNLEKIEHNHPMLSMDKTKEYDEILTTLNEYKTHPLLLMAKLDGLTCSLTYEGGKLVRAETRGNGTVGENVLHNISVLPSVPKTLPFNDTVTIDGEIVCLWPDFKKVQGDYKHPRNFAAGSIRLLDSSECCLRRLTFIAWDVIKGLEMYEDLNAQLDELDTLGFHTVPRKMFDSKIEQEIKDLRENEVIYPMDGVVIKYNDNKFRFSLGRTEHHYKNAIAFKFFDEIYTTKLIDIEYSMGRTGVLTPVAIFDPVDIDGTTVERATLHNLSMTRELLNLPYVGQEIQVYKANMVTPQVKSGVEAVPGQIYSFLTAPDYCPVCGHMLQVQTITDSDVLVCCNPLCTGQLISRLDYFCGTNGLDIKGLSVHTLEKLVEWGWLNNLLDIFSLKKYQTQWQNKEGFGERSVNKILENIENSKNVSLDKFIAALGIQHIGRSVAKTLVKYIPTYEELREKIENKFDFSTFDTFGENKSKALLEFDYTEADAIYKVLNIVKKEETNNEKRLAGLTFCVTGSLINFKNRTALKNYIEDLGGVIVSSMSKKVNYLINNNATSGSVKNLAALKLGIKIITEQDLMSL